MREGRSEGVTRLVVPVNGTPGDERALEMAGQMAAGHPAMATVMYVVEVLQSMPLDAELPNELERGERILARAEAIAARYFPGKDQSVVTDLLQARAAGPAIVDESIERHADAVVMATARRVKHGRSTHGGTSDYVLMHAPCEVVLVRTSPDDGEGGRVLR